MSRLDVTPGTNDCVNKSICGFRTLIRHANRWEQTVESLLMTRAISLLLTIAMVLAPCAVAHAASMTSHHMVHSSSETEATPSKHRHATPEGSHRRHAECLAGQHDTGHAMCAGECDILQRVSNTNAAEHSTTQLQASFAVLALAITYAHVALVDGAAPELRTGDIESISDSRSVLRKTARLRL